MSQDMYAMMSEQPEKHNYVSQSLDALDLTIQQITQKKSHFISVIAQYIDVIHPLKKDASYSSHEQQQKLSQFEQLLKQQAKIHLTNYDILLKQLQTDREFLNDLNHQTADLQLEIKNDSLPSLTQNSNNQLLEPADLTSFAQESPKQPLINSIDENTQQVYLPKDLPQSYSVYSSSMTHREKKITEVLWHNYDQLAPIPTSNNTQSTASVTQEKFLRLEMDDLPLTTLNARITAKHKEIEAFRVHHENMASRANLEEKIKTEITEAIRQISTKFQDAYTEEDSKKTLQKLIKIKNIDQTSHQHTDILRILADCEEKQLHQAATRWYDRVPLIKRFFKESLDLRINKIKELKQQTKNYNTLIKLQINNDSPITDRDLQQSFPGLKNLLAEKNAAKQLTAKSETSLVTKQKELQALQVKADFLHRVSQPSASSPQDKRVIENKVATFLNSPLAMTTHIESKPALLTKRL